MGGAGGGGPCHGRRTRGAAASSCALSAVTRGWFTYPCRLDVPQFSSPQSWSCEQHPPSAIRAWREVSVERWVWRTHRSTHAASTCRAGRRTADLRLATDVGPGKLHALGRGRMALALRMSTRTIHLGWAPLKLEIDPPDPPLNWKISPPQKRFFRFFLIFQ